MRSHNALQMDVYAERVRREKQNMSFSPVPWRQACGG
jgi:hypothetical protein